MTRGEWRNLRIGLGFSSLWIVGLGVFTLYPVAASLFYSFCDYSILQRPVWAGMENFSTMLGDDVFWISLKNTLIFAGFSVPMGLAVSLSLALLLNHEVRGRAVYRTIFYLPSIVPIVASSMLWMWIFNGQYGVLNWVIGPLFRLWGDSPPAWLGDPAWSKPALILMSLWGVGNSTIIYLAGLQDVPKEYYESASIDGASSWQRLRYITIPMISPVIYFNLIMGIIGSLQVFTQVFVMTGGTDGAPARSTLFYALYLFSTAFYDLRMGYASAMAWVLFLLIAGLTWIATRAARRRIHYSG
ncbi:MAG: sugar ABC transporter permease [Verrucomicrobia bacterium]|nr:MAG: sugar ABC transporter permease [Verrucomicrobiota bacterium]